MHLSGRTGIAHTGWGSHLTSPDGDSINYERLAEGLGWLQHWPGNDGSHCPWRRIDFSASMDTIGAYSASWPSQITSGLGILSRPTSASWVRSRVWGDIMDLVVFGAALASPRTHRRKLLLGAVAVAGVTWLDVQTARVLERQPDRNGRADSDSEIRDGESPSRRPLYILARFDTPSACDGSSAIRGSDG